MGNGSALVVQPIAKALSLKAHSDETLIKAISAGDEGGAPQCSRLSLYLTSRRRTQ
jgi:hypothetical protein